jgi:Uma2 family endonuclease
VTRTLQKPATYDDLLKVPEHLVAEIVDGELHTSPRPASRHARAAGRIYSRLSRAFEEGDGGSGGWWIVFEPELHLGGDALVPDVAGWRRERVPEFPDVTAWTIVPDWICEVLSSGTARLDRARKMPASAHHGVEHAWVVDPVQHMIEVFHLENGRWSLTCVHTGSEPANIEPFEAIEFPIETLWLPSAT